MNLRTPGPRRPVVVALAAGALAGCGRAAAPPPVAARAGAPARAIDDAADRLARYLTGAFDTTALAARDPDFEAVLFTACPVRAPELGPRALYVEQALVATPERPYRQRLYVIEPGPGPGAGARSRVFEFREPGAFVGLCARGAGAPAIAGGAVEEKPGCGVDLAWSGERFVGATAGTSCANARKGARYATSEVALDATTFSSWDRGFDADGRQVWGATSGPYVFVRKTPLPPAGPR
jgi:hypothetical protein